MATEAECQQALEAHADELMGLPHVNGIGIGTCPGGEHVIDVYVDGPNVGGIPSAVRLPGRPTDRSVPVCVVYQGSPRLQ